MNDDINKKGRSYCSYILDQGQKENGLMRKMEKAMNTMRMQETHLSVPRDVVRLQRN